MPFTKPLLWLLSQPKIAVEFSAILIWTPFHLLKCSTCWNFYIHPYSEPSSLQVLFQLLGKMVDLVLMAIAQKELFCSTRDDVVPRGTATNSTCRKYSNKFTCKVSVSDTCSNLTSYMYTTCGTLVKVLIAHRYM